MQIKFIANYIKGRKAYTLYNNNASKQQSLRTGVPQGGVLSLTLFNLYMSDIPQPPVGVQLESYADDLTPMAFHTEIQVAQAIPTTKHQKILSVTFDPKLTFNEHTNNIKTAASKSMNILKSLTATTWGKQEGTLVATYSAIVEYASTVWSPIISNTSMQKLQTVQNTALRVATDCTADTNMNHFHQETKVLPLKDHCNQHTSNFKQKAVSSNHPLNKLMDQPKPARNMKESLFLSNKNIINPPKSNNL